MPRKRLVRLSQVFMCVALCPTLSAWAAAPMPTDFAYGCALPVSDTTGLYALDLPLEVYRKLQRSDQRDLQVFNGAGQPVPQALRHRDPPRVPVRQPVPFFPLSVNTQTLSQDLSVRVQRHSDGSIITLRSDAKPAMLPHGSAYLLDLSGYAPTPDELELQWQEEDSPDMVSLRISESRDLAHWRTVRDKVVLAELAYNGGRVSRRSFTLPESGAPYLRLDCRDCRRPLRLTAVTAVSGPPMKQEQWQWHKLTNEQVSSEQGWWRIEYSKPAGFKVTALDLTFPQPNSLARVVIESRATGDAPWHRIASGDFYRLDLQGTLFNSRFLPCPANSDRQWRLSVADSASLADREQLPQLTLGWESDELIFLGRGPGPYTLAFGSTKTKKDDTAQEAMVLTALRQTGSSDRIHRVIPGAITALAGEQALQPQTPPLPWQRILLWVVLVAGVGLVAMMARSVLREMRSPRK